MRPVMTIALAMTCALSLQVQAAADDAKQSAPAQSTSAPGGATSSSTSPANGSENVQVTTTKDAQAQPTPSYASTITHTEPAPPPGEPVWQAEAWVKNSTTPWLTPGDMEDQKKKHKGPVKSFVKAIGKELGTSASDMAKDMVFVFSVQDIDPYEQKGVPMNRPAIVLKMNMVDGSSAYLRRFPDGSYAIEDGFANGTVLIPRKATNDYLVRYPNGVDGRMVKAPDGEIKIYRPDNTVTTFSKTPSGGYSMSNTKFGYMGEARPDRTGVNYEVGNW
jgi:hypothetical protein